METFILSIDQGTTGTTCIVIDKQAEIRGKGYKEIKQYYPQPGWVEHDPEEIFQSVLDASAQALSKANCNWDSISGIGITNQRETTVVWDSESGQSLHRAIVWQCRRTADVCEELKIQGYEDFITEHSGLVLDAYFSGTKLKWILDKIDPERTLSQKGNIKFGTIDAWLIYKLSGGKVHVTDHTNASRTMLYNIVSRDWDDELLLLLNIPRQVLPKIQHSSSHFAETSKDLTESPIPISGVAGDQQAALFGHCAWNAGQLKNTYGTGCFVLFNTGSELKRSKKGLITTIACDRNGAPVYALEGSVFIAGAVIQYLRDELEIISHSEESEAIAKSVDSNLGVYFIPAFVGLGAPYWNMTVKAAIMGLTRGANSRYIVRAALESIAYQAADVINLMAEETGIHISELAVDGGATANEFLMQFQSDLLRMTLSKPKNIEVTALGAAFLAGLQIKFWKSPEDILELKQKNISYIPQNNEKQMQENYKGWHKAVDTLQK